MPPGTLACVAYAAARVVIGPCHSVIHDLDRGLVLRVGGTVRGARVGLYDYDRGANFSGDLPELFDEAACMAVSLRIEGARFEAVCGGVPVHGSIEGAEATLDEVGGVSHRFRVEPL
jgi:hypothetical protein